ncbi:hypothetical protein Goshw_008555 [Gossypium schwendimanii]|uniref:Uncharacterized protein n=1 Tax=Gossypium schwendimanii TaxID=34291 RepID=A0A7J9MAE9_GOSSC|nr:hypothetical protein [Gossypium schwendimanii]
MAKKGSSTTPSRKAENKKEESVPEQKNSASKVAGNEIDEIFAGKKRKKPDPKGSEKPNGDEISKPKSSKKKSKKSKETNREGGFNESSSRPRKRTADGFAIYTEEELGISKFDAGTPLLPGFLVAEFIYTKVGFPPSQELNRIGYSVVARSRNLSSLQGLSSFGKVEMAGYCGFWVPVLVVEVIVKPYMIIPFLVLHLSNVVIIQNS